MIARFLLCLYTSRQELLKRLHVCSGVKLITYRALQTQKKRRTELNRIIPSALLLIISANTAFACSFAFVGLSPAQIEKSYPGAAAELMRDFPSCFRKSVITGPTGPAWNVGDGTVCGNAAIEAIEKEKNDAKH